MKSFYIQEKQIKILSGTFILTFHHIWLSNSNESVPSFIREWFLILTKDESKSCAIRLTSMQFPSGIRTVSHYPQKHFPDKDSSNYEPLNFFNFRVDTKKRYITIIGTVERLVYSFSYFLYQPCHHLTWLLVVSWLTCFYINLTIDFEGCWEHSSNCL